MAKTHREADLLSAGRHAVGLVQNDDLVRVRRQRHLLLRKHFDAVAHNVNAAVVAGVQLENALLVRGSEQLVREAENTGAWRVGDGAKKDQLISEDGLPSDLRIEPNMRIRARARM